MKKHISILAILSIFQIGLAQTPATIVKDGNYTVTGTETLTAIESVTLKPNTWLKSGSTVTIKVLGGTTAEYPYEAIALSGNENYIFTRSYQRAMTSFTTSGTKEGDLYESITYFDGLGRPMQQVDIKASNDLKDLVTHVGYDSHGRQDKEWLPYREATGSLGAYRGDISASARSFYHGMFPDDFPTLTATTANAYSQKDFEASPLNRVLKQAAPGEDWQLGSGHEIAFAHQANVANEVRYLYVDFNVGDPEQPRLFVGSGSSAYYGAGELYKNIVNDENHTGTSSKLHTTEEFVDKLGRTVLKRTYALVAGVETAHDTYYVYDDFGNLTYVVPPNVTVSSISSDERDQLCYQYKYDKRNRLMEKRVPGKGWESIVYNRLDQPVLTQDAVQGSNKEWLFTKYDAFGRVAYTGVYAQPSSIGRATLQGYADNISAYDQYETRQGSSSTLAGTPIYYSNNAIPKSVTEIYTINYYDSYVDTDGLSVPSTVLGQPTTTSTQGLATVAKVRVLGTNDWITTITGYDEKGRVIYTASKNNYLNTTDVVETELDFGGKVVRIRTTHGRTGYADIVTEDLFTYDHQGRLVKQRQSVDGGAYVTLAENQYDALGQLVQKTVGGGLQTVDHTYNVRGWLKGINNVGSLGSDLFAFEINYNTIEHGGTGLFNGNIAETEWKTANDNALRWYRYGYDALNRIENATASSSNYNVSGITYDKNGNIQTLTRNGWQDGSGYTNMDVLTYTYDNDGYVSNKLLKVADGGNENHGFKDGSNTTYEYYYDQNGNMTSDANKGITDITYNHLNLPTSVAMAGGTISYVYDAVGTKLEKKVVEGGNPNQYTFYSGNYIYERSGDSGNGTLQFFDHSEGYVIPDGQGGYDYVYQYKDHLGNVRLSYADSNNDGTIDASSEIISEKNYYPFGLTHSGYNNVISPNANSQAEKWRYNGKELQEELGLNVYDYGARNYDPALGRFMNMDPHAENHYSHSTYNYAYNNPIMFIDPDGRDGIVSGSGTEDDPYVITANYYYYGLSEDEAKGFNSAIAAYNNKGKSHKLKTKDGNVFVQFNLTATEKDDADSASEAASGDSQFDEDTGLTVSWGNTVTSGNVPNDPGSDGLGDANSQGGSSNHINLDGSDMANYAQSVSKTAKGVSIHEIGHNLGGRHGDPGAIMMGINQLTTNRTIGGSTTTIDTPSISRNGLRGMIGRIVTPQGYKDALGKMPSIYLTPGERGNVREERSQGRLIIYKPKPN